VLRQRSSFIAVIVSVLAAMSLSPAGGQVAHFQLKSFGCGTNVTSYGGLVQDSNAVFYGTIYNGGSSGEGMVFKVNPDGFGYAALKSFTGSGGDGAYPEAGLILGQDGVLYGTTSSGGASNSGTIFKLAVNGSGAGVLWSFSGANGDGAIPAAPLMQGSDGVLYGTTVAGGSNGCGTVFKLNTNGSGYSVIRSFAGTNGDGGYPNAGLLQASNGLLYGTTTFGGTSNSGTIFRLNTDGSGYTKLHSFTNVDGENPYAALIQGQDGALYGTTYFGGLNPGATPLGKIFKLNPDGTGYQLLANFQGFSDGGNPLAALAQATNGTLYLATFSGGNFPDYSGTVVEIQPDGSSLNTDYTFLASGGDGTHPRGPLVVGLDGALYGLTSAGGVYGNGTMFKWDPSADVYTSVLSLTGADHDGLSPNAAPIEGADGALYGSTDAGGVNATSGLGVGSGAIFRVNRDGSGYAVVASLPRLYSVTQPGLIQGIDGALYGVTAGSTVAPGGSAGPGTVFTVNTDGGDYTVLHPFAPGGDGTHPEGALMQGSDGALYGTTSAGGSSNLGTLFKLEPNGSSYTIFESFVGTNGTAPGASLIQGADGALYGTTTTGGASNLGTIFKINGDGSGYTKLHAFTNSAPDGSTPSAPLIQGSDGALYGTTYYGGANNAGTVFKISTNGGQYTNLHSFPAATGDGTNPYRPGLVQGLDGALYGTASSGGTGSGTVFKLNKDGTGYTNLETFTGANGDGAVPAGLMQGSDGVFYGTTTSGGALNAGTIFGLATTPINDNFTNRAALPSAGGFAEGNNFNATVETNEPIHGTGLSNSIWWSWTAPTNGLASVLASGSGFNPNIDIYTGSAVAGLTNIASGISRAGFPAAAGTAYQIAINGTNEGSVKMAVQAVALKVLSLGQATNLNNSINFTSRLEVANAGLVSAGPLRLKVLARAGYNAQPRSPSPQPIPSDQILGIYNLTNPPALTPGTTNNFSILGVCPAPVVIDPYTLTFFWDVFVTLEQEAGSIWLDTDSLLLLAGVQQSIIAFQGPQSGTINIPPVNGANNLPLTVIRGGMIIGPSLVAAGNTAAYYGLARFGNGTTFATNYFTNTLWTASRFTINSNGVFQAGMVTTNTPVTITGYYNYNGGQYSNQITISVVKPPSLSLAGYGLLPNRQFEFAVSGLPGSNYVIETATNLATPATNWTPLATNVAGTNGLWLFTDSTATNLVQRFYRARAQ
jgi:uncharacterized repeat protein (TIGR03803 family)